MEKGTLYLCATPIGNLEDMTFRAVRILREVAVVAAEDTRQTRKLFSHFDIHTPLVSYHEHNKLRRGPELIERLLSGDDVAVVSDAGMPGIADPGTALTGLAVKSGVPVVAIPGANAALTALVSSGLDTTAFIFIGFLPKTKKKRRALLEQLSAYPHTLILYESPHRLPAALAELTAVWGGDRKAVAARELTKKFEEVVRGTLATLQQHFAQCAPRGEFTLLVAGGNEPGSGDVTAAAGSVDSVSAAVAALMAAGATKKDAIREVASQLGIAKRVVYQAVIGMEQDDSS